MEQKNYTKLPYLHSHSALERELKMGKFEVLIDKEFIDMFDASQCVPFYIGGLKYYKVPISLFVSKKGVFKNFCK